MAFDEEWARIKTDAERRQDDTRMQLNQLPGSPGLFPSAADLSLEDGPVREKASVVRSASGEGRKKTKLDDAEAAGKAHPAWEAGQESSACTDSWQKRLRELSDMVENAADALTKGMDMQISQDGSVADAMNASAEWLGRS